MRREIRLTSAGTILCLTVIAFSMIVGCKSSTTGLQKSETRADEASIVATLRTIAVAQQSFAASNDGDFGSFPQLTEGGFLDSRFSSETPEMHGYVLTVKLGEKTFSSNADPAQSSDLKGRHFYVDATSPLIRVNATKPATAQDEVVKF